MPISSAAQAPDLNESHFLPFNELAAEAGQLLFYDNILSGNRNISCGTCHHHDLATGDGLSLGIGEGGVGIGEDRVSGEGRAKIHERIPRNAPPLFNLGASEIRVFFHDGRLSKNNVFGNDFDSPADKALPDDIPDIMAAQALFPMTSRTEMAGDLEDNEIARAAARRPTEAWDLLARRVRSIPQYAQMLMAAYPELEEEADIEIRHVASALGDFINSEWRSFDSAYDRFLRGEDSLTAQQKRGLDLFFGEAGCSTCHSGRLLSDQEFHALALPPMGPGRTRTFDANVRDRGRLNETNRIEDAYRFRTPMLRNVALTGPYGHNGAYRTLEGIVRHHLDPATALANWTPAQAIMPEIPWLTAVDYIGQQDEREMARLAARIDIAPVRLSDAQVDDIIAFLHSLTGGEGTKGRLGRPETVPSGLPVD
ncbi:cytochrome-c peroxidase [Algicella marina]|uniref:cytochrome-c peroxidase n=1 Tax=Algicella marina TaxID=2683284 RepID=UPI0024DF5FE0|nr:cytochrome c peroxidase [Algicella marina]